MDSAWIVLMTVAVACMTLATVGMVITVSVRGVRERRGTWSASTVEGAAPLGPNADRLSVIARRTGFAIMVAGIEGTCLTIAIALVLNWLRSFDTNERWLAKAHA